MSYLNNSNFGSFCVAFMSLCSSCMAEPLPIPGIVPDCPRIIEVENNRPKAPDGWLSSMYGPYLRNPDKFMPANGEHSTNSIAPRITLLNKDSEEKVSSLMPDEEFFTETEEKYTWNLTDPLDTYLFYCDADLKIFIHKPIPQRVKSCTLTILLINGERVWGKQNLECFE